MPSPVIHFSEADVVKLTLEFLQNRSLSISMLSLERETGLINGAFSDDMLFLRQLILDGQWDDAIDFVQPLASIENFDLKHFQYLVYKHKYLELLCIKADVVAAQNSDVTVDEVVKCLNQLEHLCSTRDDYSSLCLLLTLPRLSDHAEYQNWNPSNARVECFRDLCPLVDKFLAIDRREKKSVGRLQMAKNDRLVQLLIKGLLYESCVDYCQHKATSNEYDSKDMKLTHLLDDSGFSDADLSLLSWLQVIPHPTFACPFEQKTLNVDVKPLDKPSLEASWSEQILVTPIKPKIFPHSAMPLSRPRSAELMSRSLNPQYDGLAYGLSKGRNECTVSMSGDGGIMSRSFAGFHLNQSIKKSIMHTSVDKLFDDSTTLDTQSSIIFEEEVVKPHSPMLSADTPPSNSRLGPGAKTSTPLDNAETCQTLITPLKSGEFQKSSNINLSSQDRKGFNEKESAKNADVSDSTTQLYKEYQKQKIKLQHDLEEHQNRRNGYQQQLQVILAFAFGNLNIIFLTH